MDEGKKSTIFVAVVDIFAAILFLALMFGIGSYVVNGMTNAMADAKQTVYGNLENPDMVMHDVPNGADTIPTIELYEQNNKSWIAVMKDDNGKVIDTFELSKEEIEEIK